MVSDNFFKNVYELRGYNFFIPDFQRGYRWGENEVMQLLEDLQDYIDNNEENAPFYCLQPLVVKKDSNNVFKVIDGQQRLTTIFLIYKYLTNDNIFKLSYETRENSYNFLENINNHNDNDNVINDNIDFYHMHHAFQNIKKYFSDKREYENKFLDSFKDRVKVIWYEIPEYENELDVFERLNIGKIPLKDTEIVKSLFLLKSVNDNDKKIVRKKANTWYKMELDLKADNESQDIKYCYYKTNEELKKYIENDNISNNNNDKEQISKIKDDIERIELYLNLIKDSDKGDTNSTELTDYYYKKFKRKELEKYFKLLKEIDKILSITKPSNNDKESRELYHYVGYVIDRDWIKLPELYEQLGDRKQALTFVKNKIKNKLRKLLDGQEIESFLEKLDYRDDKKVIFDILLLHDMILYIKDGNEENFKFNKFKLQQYSIEHIHAMNDKSLRDSDEKNKDEYLQDIVDYLDAEKENKNSELLDKIKKYKGRQTKNKDDFNTLKEEINNWFEDNLNNIGNLTLLPKNTNSKLSNLSYKKKCELIKKDINTYIPKNTRRIFSDEFTRASQKYWTSDIQEKYVEDMAKRLKSFMEGE